MWKVICNLPILLLTMEISKSLGPFESIYPMKQI